VRGARVGGATSAHEYHAGETKSRAGDTDPLPPAPARSREGLARDQTDHECEEPRDGAVGDGGNPIDVEQGDRGVDVAM